MEHCIKTARSAGVFKEFHVLTDRQIEGAECYDAMECDMSNGFFKLHYLKAGISRLIFDYFIWVDADSVFVRNPLNVLGALARSPIHVPLEVRMDTIPQESTWAGMRIAELRDALQEAGVTGPAYLSHSSFWIIRRDAIDLVYELAMEFRKRMTPNQRGVDVDACLNYAMQMLCADYEVHSLQFCSNLWAADYSGNFRLRAPDGTPWLWKHPLETHTRLVNPAIVHLPCRVGNTLRLGDLAES